MLSKNFLAIPNLDADCCTAFLYALRWQHCGSGALSKKRAIYWLLLDMVQMASCPVAKERATINERWQPNVTRWIALCCTGADNRRRGA
jgi:hypothetical protein